IDYGPCAFLNGYDPATVFSSIDHGGRYAYGNQPAIGQWNLVRFAETLLPLLDPDPKAAVAAATEVLEGFADRFEAYWVAGMRAKLGLRAEEPDDAELARELLAWMHANRADFTNTFRDLSAGERPADERFREPAFVAWHERWRQRLGREDRSLTEVSAAMRAVNPAVIPRNHRVEAALTAAEDRDDLAPLHRLLEVLATPFELRPGAEEFRTPSPDDGTYQTFCGT
ncbi:MAG: protein adenylyltransferase SelO family protein, partial [Fimbriiglobus sp.]